MHPTSGIVPLTRSKTGLQTTNSKEVFNPTQPNPTQPNPTQPNPTQPNPTQPNPTQPNPTSHLCDKSQDSFLNLQNTFDY
jgi:hypothetical protein